MLLDYVKDNFVIKGVAGKGNILTGVLLTIILRETAIENSQWHVLLLPFTFILSFPVMFTLEIGVIHMKNFKHP